MKHRRKALSVLLTLCMLVGLLPFATFHARADATSGSCGDPAVNEGKNVTWTLDGTALTISGTGAMKNFAYQSEPNYPWESSLTSVVIEDGVTSIATNAFANCKSLATVVLPASVTSIGSSAFEGCTALKSVVIPPSVTSIGTNAFQNCENLNVYAESTSTELLNNSGYSTDKVITPTFITTTEISQLNGQLTSNYYRLNGDITLSAPISVSISSTTVLDLNGHVLDRGLKDRPQEAYGNVITVCGDLTLMDSSPTAEHTDSSLPAGGVITGGNNSGSGGGVYVAGGTFTMQGGTISGCAVNGDNADGGGVYVNNNGGFTMSGSAKISGCTATSNFSGNGGGVSVNGGTFNMTGAAAIANCTSTGDKGGNGGGVSVKSNGTFTMSGGTIAGCEATGNKAGYGGVHVAYGCKFTMSGGAISGCTANEGGVYVYGTFTMESGTISGCKGDTGGGVDVASSGKFQVSGAPVVKDNRKGESGTANDVALYRDKKVTVTGALTTGAEIWIKAGEGAGVAVGGSYTLTDADAAYFRSDDNAGLTPVLDDSDARIKFVSLWVGGKVTKAGQLAYKAVGPADAKLIAARYDGGRMTAAAVAADVGSDAAPKSVSIGTLTLGGTGDDYRLFLVNGETYAPLCAAWGSTAQSNP